MAAIFEKFFGKTPKEVRPAFLDTAQQSAKSITEALANIPRITELVGYLNQIFTDQAIKRRETVIPGLGALTQQQLGISGDLLAGRRSDAEIAAIRREAAAGAVGGGTLASRNVPGGIAGFNLLNLTGQDILRRQQFGSQLATEAVNRMAPFNPTAFADPLAWMFSPQEHAQFDIFNQTQRQQYEQARNVRRAYDASRWAMGLDELGNQVTEIVGAIYSGGGQVNRPAPPPSGGYSPAAAPSLPQAPQYQTNFGYYIQPPSAPSAPSFDTRFGYSFP